MPVCVAPVAPEELDELLPSIAAYQRFYETEPDEERNRAYFARFVLGGDGPGLLLAARDAESGALLGHATLFWAESGVEAQQVVLLNDLFVAAHARGAGAGRALIEETLAVARARSCRLVRWQTALDNRTAQGLYERVPGAQRSALFEYEVAV
jgi:GNAT superfamily N-acetyltransferase